MTALSAIRARPRLSLSAALALAIGFALPSALAAQTRGIIGWDVGVTVFLVAALTMMRRASIERMRRRAAQQDEGRLTILALTVAAVCVSFFAIGYELHDAKGLPATEAGWRIALAAVTIVLSWSFTHTMFAMHYAHEFYSGKAPSGLGFPGDQPPDYLDFLYYAFVVGMTCQVSDVQVVGRALRRQTLVHGVLSTRHSALMLAALMSSAMRWVSVRISAPNSSGVLTISWTPRSSILARSSGSRSASDTSAWILRTIAWGVPAGATRPNHEPA